MDTNSEDENEEQVEPDYKIIDMNCLSNLFSNLTCPECNQSSLTIKVSNKMGFAYNLAVECLNCEIVVQSCHNSKKVGQTSTYDLNFCMVKFFSLTGQGHSSMERFSMLMNMEGMSNRTYNNHSNNISKSSKQGGEVNLHRARE